MSWQTLSADTTPLDGWAGLWSALFTAERAVTALIQATSFAEALDLIWLADELADARDDLTRAHGDQLPGAHTVDLGPIPIDLDLAQARSVAARLVSMAIARADDLAAEAVPVRDRLWLAAVGTSLCAARNRVTGAGVR